MGERLAEIREVFTENGWFDEDPFRTHPYRTHHVLFDGQYGSTGKGLLGSVIAEAVGDKIGAVTTSAGPNSGHTAYCPTDGTKIVTKQVPVSSVVMSRLGYRHSCKLNAGAVIDIDTLNEEVERWQLGNVCVHPNAAVIKPEHKKADAHHIASTGKGVGPAIVAKIGRRPESVAGYWDHAFILAVRSALDAEKPTLVEVAQGWSLGINSRFYPHCTSRECSVSQGLSDAGVSPLHLKKSIVSLRTYPIRVGNTQQGTSGSIYPDQEEISWDDLDVEPETTTVTGRVRRVFTFSMTQYKEMLAANRPDALFINFLNYLGTEKQQAHFVHTLISVYYDAMGRWPDFVLGGYGPYNSDVKVM